MVGPFMSFRADSLDPARLEQILSRYLAYERLRLFRSRLLPRFAVLLLACWALTTAFHVLPAFALRAAIILVGATTGWVLTAELCARQQLVRELRDARRS
jgi:hypothetical protein